MLQHRISSLAIYRHGKENIYVKEKTIIDSVIIEPDNYDSYLNSGKVTIKCSVKEGTDVDKFKDGVSTYVDSANCFGEFSLEVDEAK